MASEKEIQQFIGNRIKELREEKHLSQEDLEAKSGVKNTAISSYENHKRNIGLYNLGRIARGLGVTIDELYYGSNETAPIRKAGTDVGMKVTNCIFELYKEKVIYGIQQDAMDNTIEFDVGKFYHPLSKFLLTLNQAHGDIESDEPEQQKYIEQAKTMSAYEINREIKDEEERKKIRQSFPILEGE